MKRALIAFAVAIVLAVAATLAAPSFIDWNAWRGDIANAIGAATGRRVAIDGDLNLAILPTPYLSARAIRVASVEGSAEPEMLRVAELRLAIGIGALLRGRVAITSLSLVDPVVTLERTAAGRESWNFETPAAPADGTAKPSLPIAVETVRVVNGTLIWRAPDAEPRRLERIDAQFAAAGPAGPFAGKGSVVWGHIPVAFDAKSAGPRADRPLPFGLTLDLAGGAAILTVSGDIDLAGKAARGTVGLAAPDARAMADLLGGSQATGVPRQALAIESPFDAGLDAVRLTQVSVRLGDIHGAGAAAFQPDPVPDLSASLRLVSLDLDALLAARADAPPGEAVATAPADATPAPVLPAGLRARVDIGIDTVRLRGGLVSEAKLSAVLDKSVLTLSGASARMPGGASLSLSGTARESGGALVFDGDLAGSADNLRGALVWAGADPAALPADRLRGFSWTSRVAVRPDSIQLSDIAAQLDATKLGGAATIARRDRPAFGLRLSADRINLDDYLPQPTPDGDKPGAAPGKPADRAGFPALGEFDANMVLAAQSMTWRGEVVTGVQIDARLVKGSATLREVTIKDLAGASVTLAGGIADLPGTPKAVLDGTLDGREPDRFLRFAGLADGNRPPRIGRFRLDFHAEGTSEAVAVKGTLGLLDGKIATEGRLARTAGGVNYDMAVSADFPDADRLLAAFLPDRRPSAPGAVKARFGAVGDSRALALNGIEGRIGDMTLAGTVSASFGAPRPKLTADISAGTVSLDRLLGTARADGSAAPAPTPARGNARWSREPIDLSALRELDLDLRARMESLLDGGIRIDGVVIRAVLAGGVLTLERFTGAAWGGTVDVSGTLDATGKAARLEGHGVARDVQARAALGAIAGFERLDGPMVVDMTLAATGASEYDLAASLSGAGTVAGTVRARLTKEERTKAGVAGIVGALLGAKVREAGAAGDALGTLLRAFADTPAALSGDVAVDKGRATTENLLLDGRGVRALTAGTADLANWTIDTTTTMRRDEDGPDPYLVLTLKGALDDPNMRTGGTWLKPPAPAPVQAPAPPAAPVQPVEPAPAPPPVPPTPEEFILDILKTLKK